VQLATSIVRNRSILNWWLCSSVGFLLILENINVFLVSQGTAKAPVVLDQIST